MLGGAVSPPLSTSLFMSRIVVHALPVPSCASAIFHRLSFPLTVYQTSPAPATGPTGATSRWAGARGPAAAGVLPALPNPATAGAAGAFGRLGMTYTLPT